jgi:hypothetical protein
MGSPYHAIVRRAGRTDTTRHASLDEALEALEGRLLELAAQQRPRVHRALGREYAPVAQVALRGELRGPRGLRAGVDVHGDGSATAFTGRLVRRPVDLLAGEDAYAALRRIARAAVG